MEFGFTAEQDMLRETARRFLAETWPTAMVRKTRLPIGTGHSPALLAQMAELGWLGLALPADAGGAGGTVVDLLVVSEEAGRALVPLTLHLTTTGAAMLSGAPGSGPARLLLPGVLRGDRVLTVGGRLASASPLDGGGFRLEGGLGVVPYAAGEAGHLLVAASTDGQHGGADVLAAFRCDDPAVRAEPGCTFAGDPFAMVTLEGAVAGREAIVATGKAAATILRRCSAQATVLLCADMIGGAGAVLDLTVRYVCERVQFRRPLGSFQAVQHHIADMATALPPVSPPGQKPPGRWRSRRWPAPTPSRG
jgi:alkylation response protein AidB-like acyl-CoA dehydrogenase